jgi:hypothetical protein
VTVAAGEVLAAGAGSGTAGAGAGAAEGGAGAAAGGRASQGGNVGSMLGNLGGGGGGSGGGRHGAKLALAIVLLWLAGFCFFVAFAGSKIGLTDTAWQGEGSGPAALLKTLQSVLTRGQQDQTQAQAQAQAAPPSNPGG